MATTSRSKRSHASKASTKTEETVKSQYTFVYKGKIHHGLKARIIRAGVGIKTTTKRIASKVAKPFRAVAHKAQPATTKVTSVATRFWALSLYPFLRTMAYVLGVGSFLISLIIMPLTTVGVLLVASMGMLGLGMILNALEKREDSQAARVTLNVLEFIGRVMFVAAYAIVAATTVAMCMVSIPFAVATGLLLTLRYFQFYSEMSVAFSAMSVAFIAYCVMSGAWGLAILWLLWRGAVMTRDITVVSEHTDVQNAKPITAQDVTHAQVARGAEELADLSTESSWADIWDNDIPCSACGVLKGAMRLASNAAPFFTAGDGKGKPAELAHAVLCSDCYEGECEDMAIALTGVSLDERNIIVTLNDLGRGKLLPEIERSKTNLSAVYWTESPVAWFRDRKGDHHPTQWDCLKNGNVIAKITHDYKRKTLRGVVGKVLKTFEVRGDVDKTLDIVKRWADDIVFDEQRAVAQTAKALEERDVVEDDVPVAVLTKLVPQEG